MRKPIFLLVTVLLLCDVTVPLAQQTTLSFPKEAPQFTISFANDWKAELADEGFIRAKAPGDAFAISIFALDAKSAVGAIEETEEQMNHTFQGVKRGESVEVTTANKITYLQRDYVATHKGQDRTLAIIAFSPDGQNYYALFQVSTPAASAQYGQQIVAIVNSIKPLRAGGNGRS